MKLPIFMQKIYSGFLWLFLFSSLFLLGGTSPTEVKWRRPERKHPIDLAVKKRLAALSNDKLLYRISDVYGYGDGLLLKSHTIFIHSLLRTTSIEELEKQYIPLIEQILHMFNDIPEIRPYLEKFPLSSFDISVWLECGPELRARNYYMPPYYSLVEQDRPFKTIRFKKEERSEQGILIGDKKALVKPFSDYPGIMKLVDIGVSRTKENPITPIFVDKDLEKSRGIHVSELLYPIMKNLCRKYRIHPSALRGCGSTFFLSRRITAGFWAQNQKMNLQEAKKLSHMFIDEYLQAILEKN